VARKIALSARPTRMIMFTANDSEASKVIAKSGDGVVNHLLAAIKDVFQERDVA
jgi:hypothetical protein